MNKSAARIGMITSMVIFGSIGVFRRFIPWDSSLLALTRGVIGTLFLALMLLLSRQKLSWTAVRRRLGWLIASGAAMGFNWILLFEAYNHTTVATATLCYYMAPIIVLALSPLLLHQRLTRTKTICMAVAVAGMVLVSGVLQGGGGSWKGVLLGLGAAALYASVILMNQQLRDVPAYDKTILQLGSAALAMLPYVLLTVDLPPRSMTGSTLTMVLLVGVLHTGVAYWLYFGSMGKLPAQTVALMSYIDPVVALLFSALLLGEPMTLASIIGAGMVLGATVVSELSDVQQAP